MRQHGNEPGMVKTLVTGGTGLVGSAIVRKLVNSRESVVVLTRDPIYVSRDRRVAGAVYVRGNIFDSTSLEKAMDGCGALINAVQFDNAPFENPRKGLTYERVDGEGTERQVEAAKKAGLKRIIYISGAGTREGRTEIWFRAKLRAEKAVKESDTNWTIFRPSWIYGPGDRSLNKFAMFARFLPFVPTIGSGREKIQPVYVEDVTEVVWRALNAPGSFGKIFEMGGPQTLTMTEIIQTMLCVQGKHRFILPHPKPIMKLIAAAVQYFPGTMLTPAGIDFVTMEEPVDNSALLEVFKIRLTPLVEGLSKYLGTISTQRATDASLRTAA
jgi:NADH dehydrogenase